VPVFLLIGIILLLLLSVEAGRHTAMRVQTKTGRAAAKVAAPVEGSVYGLMGLLIAFTFNGAAGRFEARRSLIVEEANAIGTAYLRVDLLPPETQPLVREDFRMYLRSRLDAYGQIPDVKAMKAALAHSTTLQERLWARAVAATRGSSPSTQTLFLSSLNEAIDITTARTVALSTHPPTAVFALLGMSVIASSVLAGYSMAASQIQSGLYKAIYAVVLGMALFVTMDYEYPRLGFIRIDPVDTVLVETLEQMRR
jgi:hypothetical protein